MTGLDDRLAALPPEKRALFLELMKQRANEHEFPISVSQQGMWFLEQLRPHNPAYVVPGAVRIRGAIDIAVLTAALDEIVRRHESLRTVFELRDGAPRQVVRADETVPLTEIDLRDRGLTDEQVQDEIIALCWGEPLELASGPLVRFTLLHTDEAEAVFVVAMHHLVTDGWSMGVLLTELSQLYEAFAAGEPSPLPDLAVQYGDFATWQQRRAADGSWDEGLRYWRQHLAGAPAALELPTDRPRPARQRFHGSTMPIELPDALVADLAALAQRHGATTYMALIAVLQVLLHRYTGQRDIVIGVPTVLRDRAELEPLIGYFVNTLPLRTVLDGDPDFTAVLGQAKEACLGAYAHQEVPFEAIVADLNIPRDLSRPPVFQVSCSYAREPLSSIRMGNARLERLTPRVQGARFDLELQAFDHAGSLRAWFEYDRDLFDETTMARLARHLRALTEAAVADPATPVSRLPLLDERERHRIVAGHNATDRTWDGPGWIHEQFEQRVHERPGAVAVRFAGESVTYAELNARANRLAHRLRGIGVRRGSLVGVCLPRSVELVATLLAVLKAGGAYVPLDPGYPPARLEYMIDDAALALVVTDRRVWTDLALPVGRVDVLALDEEAGTLAREPGTDPGVRLTGEDLAYVIYTSGSTGRPKGVMNVHAAIRNRLLWMQDEYRLDSTDRVLQKTPFSFDVSVWEFFWPLLAGATLVVAEPEGHKDAAYLVRLIREEQVTTCHFVPSMLRIFLSRPIGECTSLRRVVCSGEELPRESVSRFHECAEAELHNLYGPTEAAVDVSFHHCRRGEQGRVPIGKPIANTQLHVLDAFGQPVPPGVVGDLHIGGDNLARGYHNRPRLTAERFVADPFATRPGARLYRTGDLARQRADGTIEFLGRADGQVKLRGFRVELGEIESALSEHPGVGDAAVVARDHGEHDMRLVAYLTAASETEPSVDSLAAHLKGRLPEHMVPSAFVVLGELPLNPSGKLDRAALPEPPSVRGDSAAGFAAPSRDLEREIADLWCTVLGVERVGVHDNFFDLGGNSLLMATLQARLDEGLGHAVSMVELFRNPTVASLAEHLVGGPRDTAGAAGGATGTVAGQQRAQARGQSRSRREQAAQRRFRSRKR